MKRYCQSRRENLLATPVQWQVTRRESARKRPGGILSRRRRRVPATIPRGRGDRGPDAPPLTQPPAISSLLAVCASASSNPASPGSSRSARPEPGSDRWRSGSAKAVRWTTVSAATRAPPTKPSPTMPTSRPRPTAAWSSNLPPRIRSTKASASRTRAPSRCADPLPRHIDGVAAHQAWVGNRREGRGPVEEVQTTTPPADDEDRPDLAGPGDDGAHIVVQSLLVAIEDGAPSLRWRSGRPARRPLPPGRSTPGPWSDRLWPLWRIEWPDALELLGPGSAPVWIRSVTRKSRPPYDHRPDSSARHGNDRGPFGGDQHGEVGDPVPAWRRRAPSPSTMSTGRPARFSTLSSGTLPALGGPRGW